MKKKIKHSVSTKKQLRIRIINPQLLIRALVVAIALMFNFTAGSTGSAPTNQKASWYGGFFVAA